MNKKEKIIKRITEAGYAKTEEDSKDFYDHAKRYIKAIREGRMMCIIHKVSASGMSRTISFHECAKGQGQKRHYYLQFWSLFDMLGYRKARNCDAFVVYGCGMDMIFNTNYNNMHEFKRLGIISKKDCDKLSQMTPTSF